MIKLYSAFCGYRSGNSGDTCNKTIIERLFNVPVDVVTTEEPQGDYNLVGGGSIARDIKNDFDGFVWGAGALFENDRINLPFAKVNALRGKLTLSRWVPAQYFNPNVVLGDVGLLVSRFFDTSAVSKRYTVGIIPHYVHDRDMEIRTWLRRNERDMVCIDICGRLDDVLRQIAECEFIISSSLHGLIFSDALSIPNRWMYINDGLAGGSFKFRDYYSVYNVTDPLPILFNADLRTSDVTKYGWFRPGIEKVKEDLFNAFPRELLKEDSADGATEVNE